MTEQRQQQKELKQSLQKDLTCPVTLDLFKDPITLPCCGKAIERTALAQNLQVRSKCPLCNGDLSNFDVKRAAKNVILSGLVDTLVENTSNKNLNTSNHSSRSRKSSRKKQQKQQQRQREEENNNNKTSSSSSRRSSIPLSTSSNNRGRTKSKTHHQPNTNISQLLDGQGSSQRSLSLDRGFAEHRRGGRTSRNPDRFTTCLQETTERRKGYCNTEETTSTVPLPSVLLIPNMRNKKKTPQQISTSTKRTDKKAKEQRRKSSESRHNSNNTNIITEPKDEEKKSDFPPMYVDVSGNSAEDDIDRAEYYKVKAERYITKGKWNDALEQYTKAILAAKPPASLYANRAYTLLELNRPKAAERDCSIALKINKDSAKALRIRGKTRLALERYEKARTDLSEAQKIDYDEGTAEDLKKASTICMDMERHSVSFRIKNGLPVFID